MYVKTNFSNYVKDMDNNVVINKNTSEYDLYVQEREKSKQFRKMLTDVERLNKKVDELEKIVQQLLNSQSGNNNG